MICPYCGKENPEDLVVCDFCGGSLHAGTGHDVSETLPTQPAIETVLPPVESHEPAVEEPAAEPDTPDFDQTLPPAPPSGRIYKSKVLWIVGCIVFLCLVLGCIAGAIGVYRYITQLGFLNPAAPTQTVQFSLIETTIPITNTQTSLPQNTNLIFMDDFSNINSGWDQVEETNYTTSYFENAYRIRVNSEMTDAWANPGTFELSDVAIEVVATKNGGPDDNDFGLICRYTDIDQFYYGVISSDGYYGISKVSADSTKLLGRDTLEYSDLINQGSATNRIRFECFGNVMSLYVNNELLDSQTDNEYASGNVGLIAGTFSTSGTDILFDDFSVSSPR